MHLLFDALLTISIAVLGTAWLPEPAYRRHCRKMWMFWETEAEREYCKRIALVDRLNRLYVTPPHLIHRPATFVGPI